MIDSNLNKYVFPTKQNVEDIIIQTDRIRIYRKDIKNWAIDVYYGYEHKGEIKYKWGLYGYYGEPKHMVKALLLLHIQDLEGKDFKSQLMDLALKIEEGHEQVLNALKNLNMDL